MGVFLFVFKFSCSLYLYCSLLPSREYKRLSFQLSNLYRKSMGLCYNDRVMVMPVSAKFRS